MSDTTGTPIALLKIESNSDQGRIIFPGQEPVILNGEATKFPGEMTLFDGTMLRVGRDKTNNLILEIPNVSRFHSLLTANLAGVLVNDLQSTNGTFVNGVPISTPAQVKTGDIIEIGPAKLLIELFKEEKKEKTSTQSDKTTFDMVSASAIVTVLVADVSGYTRLSETLPSKDVTTMLQIWLDRVSRIIQKHGGEVDKYIGDCVMAYWRGDSGNAKLKAHHAAKASLEILEETNKLSDSPEWAHSDTFAWDCHISLNTGEVMIGSIGTHGSRDFTVLGDVVNQAFRLNSVSSQKKVHFVTSESTAEYIKDAYPLENLGLVKIKGIKDEVLVFAIP